MWYRGLLSLSAPLAFRLRLAAIVRGGRKIEHPFIVFLFSNSTVPQLDPAKLPLQKELLKQMIVKLYVIMEYNNLDIYRELPVCFVCADGELAFLALY